MQGIIVREIIAEIGVNFQSWPQAEWLMAHAWAAGGKTVKFQAYDTAALFPAGTILGNAAWYKAVRQIEMTPERLRQLAVLAEDFDLEIMCSAFDADRVKWVDPYVLRHKIACHVYNEELIDWRHEIGPTVQAMCDTGKPIIVSVPYAGERPELPTQAPVYYLYCVPEYPAPASKLELEKLDWREWDGFSDHTVGIDAAKHALDLGARIIEKHITLDTHSLLGPDHSCSIEPELLKELSRYASRLTPV